MADTLQSHAPVIPVVDERLVCLPTAPSDHKAKIAEYNELLEVIFQREVELTGIKSTLADMRETIAQEARILAGVEVPAPAARSDAESDIDAEHVLSDASSDKARGVAGALKKTAKKDKKPKGSRRTKVPDAQLDGDWDYKLDLAARGANRGRRASDASESSNEEVALI